MILPPAIPFCAIHVIILQPAPPRPITAMEGFAAVTISFKSAAKIISPIHTGMAKICCCSHDVTNPIMMHRVQKYCYAIFFGSTEAIFLFHPISQGIDFAYCWFCFHRPEERKRKAREEQRDNFTLSSNYSCRFHLFSTNRGTYSSGINKRSSLFGTV